jgi:ABC-type branched-subunit amino acid transport system substrate-binding protein
MFASLKNIDPAQMVKDLGESCYYRYICVQPGSTDEVYTFYNKFKNIFKFKELVVGLPFLAYAGITTLFKAIENAGKLNSDAVADEMRNIMRQGEVYTFGIPFKYDPEYPNFYQEQPAVAILTPPYQVGELTYYFKIGL